VRHRPAFPVRALSERVRRTTWMAWTAWGNAIRAAIVTTLQGADLPAAVRGLGAAVRAAGGEGLDVVALDVEGIGGDHHVGQVERGEGVEQRGEREIHRSALHL
jgi:hypothetical protein